MKGLTDWNAIFFRLNASCLKDDRWGPENFSKQKVKDVIAALKFLEKHDHLQYNLNSLSVAKMATMVAQALGGKKVSVTPDDFLPFDTRKLKKETGITEESILVLKRLMKTKKMDTRIVSMLAEELKNASMRNDE